MKTVVMIGAGQMGRAAAALASDQALHILSFGDNEATCQIYGIPVLPVAEALRLQPDVVILTLRGRDRMDDLERQARFLGYAGKILRLAGFLDILDIRKAALVRLAERLDAVDGAIAELGVYKGEFAAVLNRLFPKRRLYLFDTFSGFDGKDLVTEQACRYSTASVGDFSDTTAAAVLARLPRPQQAVVCQGYFPETANGLEERFALVSLDADLYAPTLAGLEYFLPRLADGGVIIVHDWASQRFQGVARAVADYEKKHGRLFLVPLGDLHGTAVIAR